MIPWFIKLSVLIWIAVATTHFVCCVVCHYMKIPPFIHSVYCPKILVLFQVLYWQCCCNISCASAFVHIHKYFLGCTPMEIVGSKVCTASTSPCNAIVFQSSCRCDSIALEFGGFQFGSVPQSCPTLCDPMDSSMPGFPVHHQLPEFTQTQVHWVGDAIKPSHPLSSPSPPALNLSQQQGLFKWIGSSRQVAKILEFQLQHQSFQRIFRTDFL